MLNHHPTPHFLHLCKKLFPAHGGKTINASFQQFKGRMVKAERPRKTLRDI